MRDRRRPYVSRAERLARAQERRDMVLAVATTLAATAPFFMLAFIPH
jgi:hypothetical protein